MKSFFVSLMVFGSTFFTTLAADEAPSAPTSQPMQAAEQGFTQTFVMIGIAILFFYLILWRPEQKRRKAAEELRSSMKKGDKVTAMGIVGTVFKVNEQTVILQMVDGTKIEMLKAAISEVMPTGGEEKKEAVKEEAK